MSKPVKSKKASSSPSKSKKSSSYPTQTRSSIVIKLNLAMMGLLISAMISVNMMIALISVGYITVQTEMTAIRLLEQPEVISNISENTYDFLDYSFTLSETSSGWNFLDAFVDLFSLDYEGYRSFEYVSRPDLPWYQNLTNIRYRLFVPYQTAYVEIEHSLSQSLNQWLWILLILFGLELIMIVSRFSRNHIRIANELKPLTQLTETAKNLQKDIQKNASFNKADIETIAGQLNKIDAKQLSQTTNIRYEQEELKDLALAINDLLLRINESYQSQVRFVSDASHELRTPIAVIQGYANLLDRWGKNDEKTLNESIAAIKSESDHMKTLIEHLLFLARGDSNTIMLQPESFDLNELMTETVKEARMIDECHTYVFDSVDSISVVADKQLIKQVLRILLDNAMKYSPQQEDIMLKLMRQGSDVQIIIQDNGVGIQPKDIPHIFDRFYRSDESRDKKTGGSGLGLAIAKWIIEKHGGKFNVISRVGIGTRITVILPSKQEF